jgi:pectin methylesterase-like acyl-CoA thioesterase
MAFSVNTSFDSAYYLSQNPDVAAAIEAGLIGSAEEHYNLFGFSEGRDPNPYFDTSFYLEQNPDVAAAGINPFDHFIEFGEAEGRAPNAIFDPAYYLAQNPDVAASGMSPFLHFINNGAAEGRAPNASVASQIGEGFDETAYLGANPDVAAAVGNGGLSSGYQHWLLFGFDEGREGAQNLAGETLDQPSNDGTPADNPDDSPADPDAPGAPGGGGGGGGGGAPADTTDPVFTSNDAFNVEENTTTVGTVVATDNAAVTYTISGGEDAAAFAIDGTTGALSFNTAPDFETPTDTGGNNEYLVEVTATDAAGNTATQDIEVTVEDITVKNVRTGENYTSIQDAIDAAINGDELLLDGQTFTLPATLNVNKEVTITGAGEGQTVIDASALESYGVLVEADNVTIQDLTINGPGVAGAGGAGDNYGIKVQPDTGDASDRLLNFTLEDVTVQGSLRTEIDFNGVDGATLKNVTADGQSTGGNGISLTDSANIVLEDITTTGNTWGSVAIYSYQNFYDQTPNNITFQGTYTAAEDTKIYSQTSPAGAEIGTINFNAVNTGNWQVLNSDFRAGGEAFVFFFATDAEALAFGIALNEATDPDNSASAVKGPDGKFYVFNGLSVQAAIDAAEAGDTIVLAAGVTFDEDLNINKSVTIEGANAGIAADGVRGAESNVTGRIEVSADNVTIDGVQFAPAGAVSGPEDNLITVTGANATLQNLDVDLGRNTAGEYLFGIVIQGEDATVQNSSIDRTDDGIDTTGLDRSLIRISGLDDVTIDGNELINGNIGASLGGAPTDVNITNNTITPSSTNVEAIWVVNAGTLPAAGLDLSGNTFTGDEGIQVQGSDQGDTFSSYATDKNDLFIGKDGSDFFVGGGGDDDLRGDGGTDTASYSGNQADYRVTKNLDGSYTVEHLNGGSDGTDTLTGIEFLRFADTAVPVAIDVTVVITVAPTGADYDNIQAAIDAAPEGATIEVAAGTFVLPSTLNVNKEVTITGAGEGQTVIDASALESYGVLVEADNVTIQDLTINGPGVAGAGGAGDNYGIKVQPDTGDASDRLLNFTLEDVTVQGSLRTEIDFNGVDGATLKNVTADGQSTGGNGISLTDSANIVLEDITTTGNTWGSVAIYSYQNFYDQTPNNITFQGTYTAAEDTKIYSQTSPAGAEIGTINFNAVNTGNWQVLNSDFRAGGEAFVFYFATDAEALAFGIALNEATDPDNSASAVKGPDGKFYVFNGLSVQAAIDAAEAGDTIVLAAGVTWTRTSTSTSPLPLKVPMPASQRTVFVERKAT